MVRPRYPTISLPAKVFPHDQAALKAVYMANQAAAKKWSMPIRNWKAALNRFMIEFPERMPETL